MGTLALWCMSSRFTRGWKDIDKTSGPSMASIQDPRFLQVSFVSERDWRLWLPLLMEIIDWGDTLQITVKNSLKNNGWVSRSNNSRGTSCWTLPERACTGTAFGRQTPAIWMAPMALQRYQQEFFSKSWPDSDKLVVPPCSWRDKDIYFSLHTIWVLSISPWYWRSC